MNNIFTQEEEQKIYSVVDNFQGIYERATFLAIQMEQIETEMAGLLKGMTSSQSDELELYAAISERTGLSIEEIKIQAANIAIEKRNSLVSETNEN